MKMKDGKKKRQTERQVCNMEERGRLNDFSFSYGDNNTVYCQILFFIA